MLDELRSTARRFSGERALRALMLDCQRLLSERGQANSVEIARALVERYEQLPDEQRAQFFGKLAREFSPEPAAVLASAQAYAEHPGADTLAQLVATAEPPRQELLRRINRAPGGTAAIVRMRHALLARLPRQPELRAVEADLLHLLSSWFNPGFLELRRVDWKSPAQLLEQIIRHEAVHAIDGWDDLRRRLQPDRRCFAFFHPQLPEEPLIFVEVALLPAMPAAIAPLIDKTAEPLPPGESRVAAFYSISNCQPGLRGVSLGNFLIKRVAEELQREWPQLRSFCTLSPIPGYAAWLARGDALEALPTLTRPARERALAARRLLLQSCGGELAALAQAERLKALPPPQQEALQRLAAVYLLHASPQADGDPVARFHLDNGARLERLNWAADLSRKGLKQSFGLMVNYLYDLRRIEAHHEAFLGGEVVHSRAVAAWI
ncbi:MAG: malonyl-CoA decarboxylase [Pseudomonadota bacterium]